MAKNPDNDKKKIIVLLASAVVIVTVAIAGVKLQWFGNSGDKVEPLNDGIQQEAFYDAETPETVEEQSKEETAIVEQSREKVEGGEVVGFSDGTSAFISDDTVVPEIVDIETLEEMGLRDPADNPANNTTNEQKEVYDNPIIQADSETYIEYLGKTMSLKEYYEELAQVDPESLVRGGNIERLIAYNPTWASEHGYTVEDISKEDTQADSQTQQQGQAAQQPSSRIEDNSITPAPDPSLIDNTPYESDDFYNDPDYVGSTGGDTTIDWGNADPSWIQVN